MTLRLPDRTGAAKMAAGFGRALRADGMDLTLFHGPLPVDGPSILPDFAEMGATTVLQPLLEHPHDPRLVRSLVRRSKRDGGACFVGVNQRDRAPALLAAARAGVPGVLMVQNQHRFSGWGPVPVVKARAYAAVVRRHTTLAVCTSEVVQDEISGFGVPFERTTVLPNGIDVAPAPQLAADERARLRRELGASDGDLLLLNVGRLDPQKGQDVLVTALAELGRSREVPPVRVALVGSSGDSLAGRRTDDYEAALRASVRELRLDDVVRFAGWRNDVGRLLAASDGYVHAARWEGPALPLAVMEAMAAGLPTVFTDCSGAPPVFEPSVHGLMVRTGDPVSLAEGIAVLATAGETTRRAMGARAAALIREHYRVQDVGARFARLIRRLVGSDAAG